MEQRLVSWMDKYFPRLIFLLDFLEQQKPYQNYQKYSLFYQHNIQILFQGTHE